LAVNAKHELFNYFKSGDLKLSELIGTGPVVSCAVVDCAALMSRVRESLKQRGAM
jgi:hypothetical protein